LIDQNNEGHGKTVRNIAKSLGLETTDGYILQIAIGKLVRRIAELETSAKLQENEVKVAYFSTSSSLCEPLPAASQEMRECTPKAAIPQALIEDFKEGRIKELRSYKDKHLGRTYHYAHYHNGHTQYLTLDELEALCQLQCALDEFTDAVNQRRIVGARAQVVEHPMHRSRTYHVEYCDGVTQEVYKAAYDAVVEALGKR